MSQLFTYVFVVLFMLFYAVDGYRTKPSKYMKPSLNTGKRVAKWTPYMKVNPEELGDYHEGDIMYRPQPRRVRRSTGMRSLSYRWPNAVVPYDITGTFTTSERKLILNAMASIRNRTCVRFVQRTTEDDYVNIENTNTGCWSYIGRVGGGQDLNLQSPGCVTLIGTAIHELMHAIGFIHEHTRPERDDYITILWDNIMMDAQTNFDINPSNILNNFGITYDYGSVMHYSAYAFSKNGQPTIQTQTPATIGQRTGLSTKDINSIKKMYGCS